MKEIIFSRKDAKTAKGFLGELRVFARVILKIGAFVTIMLSQGF